MTPDPARAARAGGRDEDAVAVIFDMDGVLIDSGAHHRAAWRALLEEIGEEPAHPEHWRLTIGRPSEEAVPLLLGRGMPEHEVGASRGASATSTSIWREAASSPWPG